MRRRCYLTMIWTSPIVVVVERENCSGIVPLWPSPAHSTVQDDVAVTVYLP
jgi:hypothetical protein